MAFGSAATFPTGVPQDFIGDARLRQTRVGPGSRTFCRSTVWAGTDQRDKRDRPSAQPANHWAVWATQAKGAEAPAWMRSPPAERPAPQQHSYQPDCGGISCANDQRNTGGGRCWPGRQSPAKRRQRRNRLHRRYCFQFPLCLGAESFALYPTNSLAASRKAFVCWSISSFVSPATSGPCCETE